MKVAFQSSLIKNVVVLVSSLIILSLLVVTFYHYDPASTYWYPKCIIHYLTGYQCPSCGGERFMYNLIHGNIEKALTYNLFIAFALPYFLFLTFTHLSKTKIAFNIRKVLESKTAIYLYLITYIIWGFSRNILKI